MAYDEFVAGQLSGYFGDSRYVQSVGYCLCRVNHKRLYLCNDAWRRYSHFHWANRELFGGTTHKVVLRIEGSVAKEERLE